MELHATRFRGSLAGWCLLAGLVGLAPGCAYLQGAGFAAGTPAAKPQQKSRTVEHGDSHAPPVEAPAPPAAEYILQPGDEIDIQIYREPDLSGGFKLNPEGEIRHPLLGAVPLARETIKEAEAALTRRLAKDYLVNPRVLIKLVSTQSSQIVLLGEIKNPGVYPLPFGASLTLLQAIAGAGGFTELASPDRVRIVRRMPDGHQTTLRVSVSDLLKSRAGKKDVPLEPNDVIMVDQVLF